MFFLYFPISLIGTFLAYPLVPIAVIFADDEGRLPKIFRWLETHDALGWFGPSTEEATRKTTERFGKKAGLMHYLIRNKAYTLRYWMRAKVTEDMKKTEKGTSIPSRWGFSYWYGKVGKYWEFQPRIGFGKIHLYMRMGWKMKPYFDMQTWPKEGTSAGIFTGVSIRSDDWDDYPEA